MQKVGNTTDTADANGEYTNGNVAQGIPPTIINAEMLNTFQRELVNVVEGAGMTLDPQSYDQLLLSIKKITQESGDKYAKITGDTNQKFWVKSAPGDVNSAVPVSLLNIELQEKANLNGDANVDFYVRNNGNTSAAVNNERLDFVLGNYAYKGGDASQGFAVAGGSSANSAVAFNQFQSGNNGNGAWVKLPGGGQWCRTNLNLTANGNTTWTFPASFPNTPGIYITTINGEFKCWMNGAGPSDCSIYNNGPALNVNVLAIW